MLFRSQKQSIFGRYLGTRITIPPGYGGGTDNILKTNTAGSYNLMHSVSLGDTLVLSQNLVNAARATINYTHVKRYQNPLFSPADVGIKLYSYAPGGQFPLTVNGAFTLQQGQATKREEFNTVYAFSDDLTVVKGSHQFGFGAPSREEIGGVLHSLAAHVGTLDNLHARRHAMQLAGDDLRVSPSGGVSLLVRFPCLSLRCWPSRR